MKLKTSLLYEILENPQVENRYSKSFMNIKNVLLLEEKEGLKEKNKILYENFEKIKIKYENFLDEIPLQIIEKYYYLNKEHLGRIIFIQYKSKELKEIQVIEIYEKLELFFNDLFTLACEIANYYNLEIKLNANEQNNQEFI